MVMPDDDAGIVALLRGHAEIMERDKGKFIRFIDAADCVEAADRIEAQAAKIERLRAKVKELMDELAFNGRYPND